MSNMSRVVLASLLVVLAMSVHEPPKLKLSAHNVDIGAGFFEELSQDAEMRLKMRELREFAYIFSSIAHRHQNPDADISVADRASDLSQTKNAIKMMMNVFTRMPIKEIEETLRGSKFTEEEAEQFDLQMSMIGNEKVADLLGDTAEDMQSLLLNPEITKLMDDFNTLMERREMPGASQSPMHELGAHMREAGTLVGKMVTSLVPKMMELEKKIEERGVMMNKELGMDVFPTGPDDDRWDA